MLASMSFQVEHLDTITTTFYSLIHLIDNHLHQDNKPSLIQQHLDDDDDDDDQDDQDDDQDSEQYYENQDIGMYLSEKVYHILYIYHYLFKIE